jgi:hypothetical protein
LIADLGMYSGKPDYNDEVEHNEKLVKINRKKATIVFFKFGDSTSNEIKYIAAVYFPRIGLNEMKLSFVAYCKTPEEQKIAEKIFRSIKFKSQ